MTGIEFAPNFSVGGGIANGWQRIGTSFCRVREAVLSPCPARKLLWLITLKMHGPALNMRTLMTMVSLCSTFSQPAGRGFMRIEGYWLACDDGVARPVVDAHVVGRNNVSFYDRFLVDIGADRTVFTAHLARKLGLSGEVANDTKVVGIGGEAGFIVIKTSIQLLSDEGAPIRLKGEFAAFSDETAIDHCVLGRDVPNHFDCIVSRRNSEVLLLAENHRYAVIRD